jgi:hypothetical protein
MGLEFMQNADLNLRRSQRTCVVVCPTAKMPAKVKLDANLGLESCSRWPEYGNCAQTCMPQIQFSPESLEDFVAIYGGCRCACCGAVLMATDWYDNRLGALRSVGETSDPSRVPLAAHIKPEDTRFPVCAVCYSAKQGNQECDAG